MKASRHMFPLERMACVLEVSASGYYAWLGRDVSSRARKRKVFDSQVRQMFEKKKRRCGYRRVHVLLERQGIPCSQKRVQASMQRQGLRVRPRRKYVVTTQSRHDYPVSPNLLARNFTAAKPNQIWTSDITYLRSKLGWLYLVVFLDLYSRAVVGWKVSTSLRATFVVETFERAAKRRRIAPGLIVHSDRGVQYCCSDFRDVIKAYGVTQSMSRKGDCWDNAVTESVFSTLKKEMPAGMVFENQAAAERYLFEYIEVEYNHQRLHSTLRYRAPMEYEAQMAYAQQLETRIEEARC
ncbi:MAG: IS3 family transposase [Bacteroidetes bacterium]|nr:IS3 family transposase [Bacteroidota bacterium]